MASRGGVLTTQLSQSARIMRGTADYGESSTLAIAIRFKPNLDWPQSGGIFNNFSV
jgi:hypothetical protein